MDWMKARTDNLRLLPRREQRAQPLTTTLTTGNDEINFCDALMVRFRLRYQRHHLPQVARATYDLYCKIMTQLHTSSTTGDTQQIQESLQGMPGTVEVYFGAFMSSLLTHPLSEPHLVAAKTGCLIQAVSLFSPNQARLTTEEKEACLTNLRLDPLLFPTPGVT